MRAPGRRDLRCERHLLPILPPLVLASASPRRRELLSQLGVPFRVEPSTVRETHDPRGNAIEVAERNATAKANAVAERLPGSLILGADTLVFLDDVVLGKPLDMAEAEGMLARLSGRTHQVVTAVCLFQKESRRRNTFTEITAVTFRKLTSTEIRAYLATIDPMDKAGSYAIQENGDAIVHSVTGSYSNVVGLPVERLQAELERWVGPR